MLDPRPSEIRRGVTLRATLRGAIGALVALLLSTALALGVLTTFLHRAASNLGSSLESLRVAQEIQVALMTHHRATIFAAINHEQGYAPAAWAIEARLARLLEEARSEAPTPEERALVERTSQAIAAYHEAQHGQAAAGRPPEAVLLSLAPKFDAAFAAVDALVWFNVDEGRAWTAQAARWDWLANVMSVSVGILALAGAAGLLVALRSRMFQAMADLHDAVCRFVAGDPEARAPVVGAREVREIAASFNDMADALNRHEHGMLVFLGGLAQDLRDPLTVIKALARSAEGDALGPLSVIERQVRRMERILRDVVDGTLMEAGKLDLRRAVGDLRPPVLEAVDAYRTLSPEHSFAVAVPDHAVDADVDAARIEHVLVNLLSNAVKYSAAGSLVSVSLSESGGSAIVAVADQGIGLEAEERARIFERYRRTGASRGLITGAGLGLWATRRIVEAHGGKLEVDSVPGAGSTFRITLPLAPSTPASAPK